MTRDRVGPPPRITRTFTHQQGTMVFFEIYHSDPGHNAAGFGFVRANGSDWPKRQYSFSPVQRDRGARQRRLPARPVMRDRPGVRQLRQGLAYDEDGARRKPVVIDLACTT